MRDSIERRGVEPDDRPFLLRLYASVREAELSVTGWDESRKAAFIASQFDVRERSYAVEFPDGVFDAVLSNGEPIGRLSVETGSEMITVIDIALLPAWRGRGIGSSLLMDVLAEAGRGGKLVRLSVEPSNPARRLYERLGFRRIGGGDIAWEMEAAPASPQLIVT